MKEQDLYSQTTKELLELRRKQKLKTFLISTCINFIFLVIAIISVFCWQNANLSMTFSIIFIISILAIIVTSLTSYLLHNKKYKQTIKLLNISQQKDLEIFNKAINNKEQ